MAKRPFEVNVSSKYGAPMGRRSDQKSELCGRVHLARVPMVDGDYDPGGAYWGGGRGVDPLFCAWDEYGTIVYFRTHSWEEARAQVMSYDGGDRCITVVRR